MDEHNTEELLAQAAEGAANFLRGVCMDTRLPSEMKQAFMEKALQIEEQIEAAQGY